MGSFGGWMGGTLNRRWFGRAPGWLWSVQHYQSLIRLYPHLKDQAKLELEASTSSHQSQLWDVYEHSCQAESLVERPGRLQAHTQKQSAPRGRALTVVEAPAASRCSSQAPFSPVGRLSLFSALSVFAPDVRPISCGANAGLSRWPHTCSGYP